MRKNSFDKKFGADFLGGIPNHPGVYEILDESGDIVYVGKAKRLRRRLQQYRNARRCKKHHKMRAIVQAAASIRWQSCTSDLDALLLENKLIQKLRPKFNIAGAFSFLYPVIGIQIVENTVFLCYTTTPKAFEAFEYYGAFRSRHLTREGYFALLELFSYVGHREPQQRLKQFPKQKYSHVAGFRQIAADFIESLKSFLRGDSHGLLEKIALSLLDKSSARRNAESVEDFLKQLKRFYRFEANALRKALRISAHVHHFISQEDRDALFLNAKHKLKSSITAAVLQA